MGVEIVAEIKLDYAIPAPDVAEYVTLFYALFANVPVLEDVERADNAQIRFVLSAGAVTYRFPDGTVQKAPPLHVLAPTVGAVKLSAEGPIIGCGMGLTAAGWAAIVGADASTVLNRVIDANDLLGAERLGRVETALHTATTMPERAAIGEAFVRDMVRNADAGIAGFVRDVEAWLAASPSPEMPALVAATGLSRRHIERRCNALYGAPPKVLARKYRALRAAVAMAEGLETPGDAIERGFYDQSHMIREVKHFTGLTPGQIRAEPTILSQLTMSQRAAMGDKVGPLVSGT